MRIPRALPARYSLALIANGTRYEQPLTLP